MLMYWEQLLNLELYKSLSVFLIIFANILAGLDPTRDNSRGKLRFIYLMFETILALATVGVMANQHQS